MLSIITGAEDSELAPDLGHVSLIHRCGLGAHGVRGARGGRMLLTRMGPGSSFMNLLPTGPASEASGCCLRCLPHAFLTPHQPGRLGLEKGLQKSCGGYWSPDLPSMIQSLLGAEPASFLALSDFVVFLGTVSPRAFCLGSWMPGVSSPQILINLPFPFLALSPELSSGLGFGALA